MLARYDLTASAVRLNGTYIEDVLNGYTTISAKGRDTLTKELELSDYSGDGSKIMRERFPARTIEVEYVLQAETIEQLHTKYNLLNALLNVKHVAVRFNDESDKYFIGTVQVGEISTSGKNAGKGTYTIVCTDPFKYSDIRTVTPTDGVYNINYQGTYKAFPQLVANFSADCGFVGYVNKEGKMVQAGSPNESDYGDGAFPASQTLINDDASALVNWASGDHVWNDTFTISGSTSTQSIGDKTALVQTGGSGSKFYGCAIKKPLPADSSGSVGADNFTFLFEQKLAFTAKATKENGYFCATVLGGNVPAFSSANTYAVGDITSYSGNTYKCKKKIATAHARVSSEWTLLHSGTRHVVAQIRITKSATGSKFTLNYVVADEGKGSTTFDGSYANKYFGFGASAPCSASIVKSNGTVTFNVGGLKKTVTTASTVKAEEIQFSLGGYGTSEKIAYNGLYGCKFIKDMCDTWGDIPNKFTAGDELELDCSSAKVLVNGLENASLGALGNDWEGFYLEPGNNVIQALWSEWATAPTLKLIYQERYL